MIDREEIELKASEFGVHTANVERDYVFGWLLAGIYGESKLADQLILKGGNCLRKAYFADTRFSGDLDFSTESLVNPELLKDQLNAVCDVVQREASVIFDKDRNSVKESFAIDAERKVYEARLYFKDFYGNADHITLKVKLDITQYDRIYLPVQERYIIHPYSDLDKLKVKVRCIKLEEVLGTKLKCLLQRRETADLYDFVFSFLLNKAIDIQRGEVATTFLKKTIFEPSPGVVKNLLLELPLHVLRSAWEKYIVCPLSGIIDFDHALENFRAIIEALFGSFPSGGFRVDFFPSHLRNPIIEAGTNMRLIALTYDGIKREVEPYSLVFKRRKRDNYGQEYFYGYDRTGGHSGPGIKCFVHRGIQGVEVLETTFEPKYEVELSKAGEYGDKQYFGRPFGSSPRRRTSTRRPRSRSGITYVFQCPVCHKRFKRSKYSTRLNEHKDPYGNRCFGRLGYLVEQY